MFLESSRVRPVSKKNFGSINKVPLFLFMRFNYRPDYQWNKTSMQKFGVNFFSTLYKKSWTTDKGFWIFFFLK